MAVVSDHHGPDTAFSVHDARYDTMATEMAVTVKDASDHGLVAATLRAAAWEHRFGQEYKEHEDLPNTTNPDDWAKISGKKGERIVFIRTLVKGRDIADREGGRAIERVATGQYLSTQRSGPHECVLAQEGDVLGRHGSRVQVALCPGAAEVAKHLRLLRMLHPFRGDGDAECVGQGDDAGHQSAAAFAGGEVGHEAAVDLQHVDRVLEQIGERCVPGAEVVGGDLDPPCADSYQVRSRCGGGSQQRSLGDLHAQV
jgi:hypothetical protein